MKNAVEAYDGAAPVHVRLRARVEDGSVVIEVEDHGRGFHPDAIESAFVPFASKKPGGTGFGLFIARRVARNVHGGELVIASAQGRGTTVTMRLPVRQEAKKRAVRRAKG